MALSKPESCEDCHTPPDNGRFSEESATGTGTLVNYPGQKGLTFFEDTFSAKINTSFCCTPIWSIFFLCGGRACGIELVPEPGVARRH